MSGDRTKTVDVEDDDGDNSLPSLSALRSQETQQSSQLQSSSTRFPNYGSIDLSVPISPALSTPVTATVISRDCVEQRTDPDEETPLTEASSPASGSSTPDDMKSTLSVLQKIGYGLGHIYNDLCAAVWFSYTLMFLKYVLILPQIESGALMMLGQVCDAIATPIVGVLADRYGTKRRWHTAGTALVFISFPMIFALCPQCSGGYTWWSAVYFSTFIALFQAAWAIVQISHFAMIPELSKTSKDRADLTATRYSASVIANLVVYVTMWLALRGRTIADNKLVPEDSREFRDVALVLTLIGLTMSIIFHFSLELSDYEHRRIMSLAAMHDANYKTIPSPHRRQDESGYNTRSDDDVRNNTDTNSLIRDIEDDARSNTSIIPVPQEHRRRITNLLKSPALYQKALLYVFARLFMTTSLIYIPLWLHDRAAIESVEGDTSEDIDRVELVATVPLVSFVASFLSSMMLKQLNKWFSHGFAYLLGSALSIATCVWVLLITPRTTFVQLFAVGILMGSGSSITMVSSLCITADMIGRHTYQGGIIYSAVTFADKLITGIVIFIIEAQNEKQSSNLHTYYQNVLGYVCGMASILGIVTLWTLRCTRRRRIRNDTYRT